MNIKEKRKEITYLIENIKEHSDRLTDDKNIPILELSAILSKSTKLHEELLILKFMLEHQPSGIVVEGEEVEELEEKEEVVHDAVNVEEELVPEAKIEELQEEVSEKEEDFQFQQLKEEIEEFSGDSEVEKEEEHAQDEEILATENLVEEEQKEEEEELPPQIFNEEEEISDNDADQEENEVDATEEETVEDEFPEKELSLNEMEQQAELSSKPDVNEIFSEKEDDSLSEQLKKQPIRDLLSAIALNERYLYANELFDGDIEDFRKVMGMLNEFESGDEASRFFDQELRQNYGWEEDNEMAKALYQLIERRFQS